MRETRLTIPELGLIAGTRGMLGGGIGLLLAGYLSREQRKAIGWTLVAVGAVTTIPLVLEVLGKDSREKAEQHEREVQFFKRRG
ncbi:MAG: hypothetical protein ACREHD_12985 [Pirellulales bacterium]